MATAIKAIPTLYGEEARRFQEMALEVEQRYDPSKKKELNERQKCAIAFLKQEGWMK